MADIFIWVYPRSCAINFLNVHVKQFINFFFLNSLSEVERNLATGFAVLSICRLICFVFNLPTPLNNLGYCCRIMDFKSLTPATLAPILSTPNLTAVSFPSSGSPRPQKTVNSATVLRFPIPTSHQKIPLTGKISLDEYAYSFLSDLAELYLIFSFSISHVFSSTVLLVALESTNIGSLMLPTEKVILSILLYSFTTNANS